MLICWVGGVDDDDSKRCLFLCVRLMLDMMRASTAYSSVACAWLWRLILVVVLVLDMVGDLCRYGCDTSVMLLCICSYLTEKRVK